MNPTTDRHAPLVGTPFAHSSWSVVARRPEGGAPYFEEEMMTKDILAVISIGVIFVGVVVGGLWALSLVSL